MSYWIFKCNPAHYRLPERMADSTSAITWTVSRYRNEIDPGDTVFLWKTGKERAIIGIFRVDESPCDMPELENEQQYWTERDTEVRCRVKGTMTHRDLELGAETLRATPGLENLSVFRGFQQATNFPVTENEGRILMSLVDRQN